MASDLRETPREIVLQPQETEKRCLAVQDCMQKGLRNIQYTDEHQTWVTAKFMYRTFSKMLPVPIVYIAVLLKIFAWVIISNIVILPLFWPRDDSSTQEKDLQYKTRVNALWKASLVNLKSSSNETARSIWGQQVFWLCKMYVFERVHLTKARLFLLDGVLLDKKFYLINFPLHVATFVSYAHYHLVVGGGVVGNICQNSACLNVMRSNNPSQSLISPHKGWAPSSKVSVVTLNKQDLSDYLQHTWNISLGGLFVPE